MFVLRRIVLILVAIAGCCVPSSARAANLLLNGGFDTGNPSFTPPNFPTSLSGAGVGAPSSATDWTIFNGTSVTTSTELLTSTDPSGSGLMIHVTTVPNTGTDTAFSGLEQGFTTQIGVPVTVSVDVDVLSPQGSVFVGLFANNGGTLLMPFVTTTTLGWQTLTFTVPAGTDVNSEPNLIAIYSDNFANNVTNEFYADNASVTAVPEPTSGLLALIGMSATAFWFRKNRPRLGRRHRTELAA
jgi:hypothetical protein